MKKVFALILAIAVLASLFCVNAFAGQITIRDWDPAKEVAACCDGWKFDRQSSLTSFSPTAENNVIDNTANECMERLVVQIWFGAVNGKPSRVGLLIDESNNILWAPENAGQGWGFYAPGAGAVTAGGANTVASFMNIPANVLPADGKTHTLTVVADFDSEIVKLKDTMHGSIDMAFTFKAPNARNFIGKKSTAKSSLYNPLGTTGLSYQDNQSRRDRP